MTDIERMAIEWACTRLINLYATLNDAARWEEVAALYAEDALMTRPTAPDVEIVGKAAILACFLARPVRVSRHFCANIVIDVESATAARATSNLLLYAGSVHPDGGLPVLGSMPLVGEYRDRFALTNDGWRFVERRGMLAFRAGA